jgi:Flp pilus assembly pilin Flp
MIKVLKLLALGSGATTVGHGMITLFISSVVIIAVERIVMRELRKLNDRPRVRLP